MHVLQHVSTSRKAMLESWKIDLILPGFWFSLGLIREKNVNTLFHYMVE